MTAFVAGVGPVELGADGLCSLGVLTVVNGVFKREIVLLARSALPSEHGRRLSKHCGAGEPIGATEGEAFATVARRLCQGWRDVGVVKVYAATPQLVELLGIPVHVGITARNSRDGCMGEARRLARKPWAAVLVSPKSDPELRRDERAHAGVSPSMATPVWRREVTRREETRGADADAGTGTGTGASVAALQSTIDALRADNQLLLELAACQQNFCVRATMARSWEPTVKVIYFSSLGAPVAPTAAPTMTTTTTTTTKRKGHRSGRGSHHRYLVRKLLEGSGI